MATVWQRELGRACVLTGIVAAGIPALAGSVATTWTCTTDNWGQTACWSTLNGGDTYPDNGAATYDVTLPDGGANYTLTMAPGSDPSVTIDSLNFQNTLGTGKPTLSISAGRTFIILDSLTSRGQIITSGTFTVNPGAAVDIDESFIRVQSGGTATVPATTFTLGNSCGQDGSLRATGAGSFLDISSLTTVIQPGCGNLTIRADSGGEVDASSLFDGGSTCAYQADGAGSVLHLDSLTTLTDTILVSNGGTLIAGPIDTLDRAELTVSGAASVFDVSQISSVSSSNITASSGAMLSFPQLISTTSDSVYGFTAISSGSVLDFPNLTTVTSTNLAISLRAFHGGTLHLPALTTTTSGVGGVEFRADGEFGSSLLNIPLIDTVHFNNGLIVRDGAQVNAAPLIAIHGSLIVGGAMSTIDLSQVADVEEADIAAETGATVVMPSVTSYTGTLPPHLGDSLLRAVGAGAVLSFPSMTALDGGGASYGVVLEANAGGTVSLPALQTMIDTVHLRVQNSANSLIVLGVVDLKAGTGCSVSITGGGTVRDLGDFSFELTNESNWTWSGGSTLEMTGQCSGAAPVSLEIGGNDLGVNEAGYTANFHLDRLRIGSGALVQLVDAKNNGNRNGVGGAAEALYVDTLEFADAAGVLYTDGLHLYYHTLIGNPGQIVSGSAPGGGCDDGNPCTDDACVANTCQFTNNSDPCDDGLFCTGVDSCTGGTCVSLGNPCFGMSICNEANNQCTCLNDADCDDGNVCTTDSCVGNACTYVDDCAAAAVLFEPGSWATPPAAPGGGGSFVDDIMSTMIIRDAGGPLRGVYLHSGEVTEQDVDLYIPGLEMAPKQGSVAPGIPDFNNIWLGMAPKQGSLTIIPEVVSIDLLRLAPKGGSLIANIDLQILAGSVDMALKGGSLEVTECASGFGMPSPGHTTIVTGIDFDIAGSPVGGSPMRFFSADGNSVERNVFMGFSAGGIYITGNGLSDDASLNSFADTLTIIQGLRPTQHPLVFARKYRSRVGPTTAMGNGWDFSYNIYIEQAGADRVVHDGWTRADVYEAAALNRGGNPTWTKREFFRELEQNPDLTHTLTFSDQGKWNFYPLDSGPVEVRGKISSIVDRTGNTTTFTYDVWGWLTTITDPLGRDVTITHHAGPLSNYIESVCDFTGRCVNYAHYDGVEPGGNFGDLKSVTSPAVTGTPTGNDFPSGKTITYRYSTGNADEALNHNLTEIIDAKGQTIVYNGHAGTTNPADPDYDHVVSQQWGSAGQTSHVTYTSQTPSAGNGFATVKAIVNDRVGNVSEHFYDAGNRLVRLHEYTGRAIPGIPTTDGANRPINPLRQGDDPAYFETQFEWNIDSLPTRTVYPNGNEVTRLFDMNHALTLHRGDMLQRCALPGPLGGDQAQICESFEYNTAFGGAAGISDINDEPLRPRFVTKYTNPRGHDTLVTYGAEGNLTSITHAIPTIVEEFRYNPFGQLTRHIHPDNGSGHRRVDKFNYYGPGDGAQNGYLKNVIVDALHDDQNDPPGSGNEFQLTITLEYNAVGVVTRAIDPKGGDVQFVRNSLNQVVRWSSREVTLGGGIRYEWDFFYDANDNLVRVDMQNKDEAGVLQANSHFTTVIEREILNRPTKVCRESGSYTGVIPGTVNLPVCTGLPDAEFVRNEYEYDANRNVSLVRSGEAAEGRQPNNTVALTYDERDLLFSVVRAPSDTAQSTTQVDYDANGNLKRVTSGVEDVPGQRVSLYTYDGYNRLMSATDPMGNVSEYHYDPNGNPGGFADAAETTLNPFAVRVMGELTDVAGSAGNVRLAELGYEWDFDNRPISREAAFFNPATQTPLAGGQQAGKSITTFAWTGASQVQSVTDDNGNVTSFVFDTVARLKTRHDFKNNTVTYGYDANGNVTSVTEVEKSDLAAPDQVFVKTWTFDGPDRRISRTDNVGNTHTYAYDSRGNVVRSLDAASKETAYVYDGLGRRTATARDMDGDGANANDEADIVTSQTWDDSSRRVALTDDNGNAARYAYDALNRLIVTQMADGTIHQAGSGAVWTLGNDQPNLGGFVSGYDVHHNAVTRTDANGTVVQSLFDLNNRVTDVAVTPGAGVSADTTFETFEYDGAGQLVSATDNDSVVLLGYDSMGNVIQDVQNGESVISNWDGWNNLLSCTYPGGRVISRTYDELNRLASVADSNGTIATYDYIGPGRVERRTFEAQEPNDTFVDYTYDGITGVPNPPGDFGVKQVIGTVHGRVGGGPTLDNRTYAWDRDYNKTQRKDVRASGPMLTHDYEYDAAFRLVHTQVTDAAMPTPNVIRDTTYDLDGVHNRTAITDCAGDVPVDYCPGEYFLDDFIPPADFHVNQYSVTPCDCREYDEHGNLTRIVPRPYGDIAFPYCTNDVDDIILVLDGFSNPELFPEADIYPCGGNGKTDVDDILTELDVFAGFCVCPGPCQEEAIPDCTLPGNEFLLAFDYQGRMTVFSHASSGLNVVYRYDALGRRTAKMVDPNPRTPVETRFFYSGWQIVEEQNELGQPQATYVFGNGIDEVLQMRRDGVNFFYHADGLGNIMAVSNTAGNVVERYEYADFGAVTFLDPAASPLVNQASAIGNPYLFTGRNFDGETGWYDYRTRYLDPIAGRFTTRDTIGIWGDPGNLGNGATYVGNNPWTFVDPTGRVWGSSKGEHWYDGLRYPPLR